MKKYLITILSVLFLFSAHNTLAAAITISPQSGSFEVGKQISMNIFIDPAGQKIDTARLKLNFSPGIIKIKSFSPSQSFSFQSGANGFDNNAGTFSWGAGIAGGTLIPVSFGKIIFTLIKPGNAQVSVGNDSLILSSGQNFFSGQPPLANFTITSEPIKNINKTPAQTIVSNSSKALPQVSTDNSNVDTQIFQSSKPQNFSASIFGIPFRSVVIMWFVGLILIISAMLFIILRLV